MPPALSLLIQVPAESTRSPRGACEKQGRRREAGGRSLPFCSSKHFPRERNPPRFLLLCLIPHDTSSPALAVCRCCAWPPEGGRLCDKFSCDQTASQPLSLSLLVSLGWCSGILIACHGLAMTQEGLLRPPSLRKSVWVNSLSKGSPCFPKIRHKDSAAVRVI